MSDHLLAPGPYWQRLGIDRPKVEPHVGRRDVKLFHLLVLALLEHGEPASFETLAGRLARAGVTAGSGDLVSALKRAWHGLPPLLREQDGRLTVDLTSPELDWLLLVLNLRAPRFPPLPAIPPPPPEPADDEALTDDELEAAFTCPSIQALSSLRQTAAILDAAGRPMRPEEVEHRLAALREDRGRRGGANPDYWRSDLITGGPDGRLSINRRSFALKAMRRAVRKLSRRVIVDRWNARHREAAWRQREEDEACHRQRRADEAIRWRHAIVHVVPAEGEPRAAALIDVGSRRVSSWHGAALQSLREQLADFDVVAALDPRGTLRRLGLQPDRWRLADLRPPQKTKRLTKGGRTLTLTPELITTSTTNLARPLASQAQISRYLASGAVPRLLRRLEADAKALFALYQYGRLHRYVRLRLGFLDEILYVSWSTPADRHLSEVLDEAGRSGAYLEIVLGTAPGWVEPWARAWRVRVLGLGMGETLLLVGDREVAIPFADIQSIRPVADHRTAMTSSDDLLQWPTSSHTVH